MGWKELQSEIDSIGKLKKNGLGFYDLNMEGIDFCIAYNPLLNKIELQYWYVTKRSAVEPTKILYSPENITLQKIFQEIVRICEEKEKEKEKANTR